MEFNSDFKGLIDLYVNGSVNGF